MAYEQRGERDFGGQGGGGGGGGYEGVFIRGRGRSKLAFHGRVWLGRGIGRILESWTVNCKWAEEEYAYLQLWGKDRQTHRWNIYSVGGHFLKGPLKEEKNST